MNVRYVCGDDEVWAPADDTDAVFRSLVEYYEQRHETGAGIDWGIAGEAHIEGSTLVTFAQNVADEWETVESTAFHVLADGLLATLQVICERCNIELDVSDRAYWLAVSMRRNM